jgi:hypothetical protein
MGHHTTVNNIGCNRFQKKRFLIYTQENSLIDVLYSSIINVFFVLICAPPPLAFYFLPNLFLIQRAHFVRRRFQLPSQLGWWSAGSRLLLPSYIARCEQRHCTRTNPASCDLGPAIYLRTPSRAVQTGLLLTTQQLL